MRTQTFRIDGLKDKEAIDKANQALHSVWGILAVDEASVAKHEIVIRYDEKAASAQDFIQALDEIGLSVVEEGTIHGEPL